MIAAPIRNTIDIESENPTLNGCAITGASREMNDVSFRSVLPWPAACEGRGLVRVRGQRRLERGRVPRRVERVRRSCRAAW